MHFDLILRNAKRIFPWGGSVGDVAVHGGKIVSFSPVAQDTAEEEVDLSGLHLLPGLMDSHVHLREPGKEHAETIATGAKGAALGGLTTILDMPNNTPPTIDNDSLSYKVERARQEALVNIGFYMGASQQNIAHLAALECLEGVCAIKVFAGSSTGDLLIGDEAGIRKVLQTGHRRVAFHAEDEDRLQERAKTYRHSGASYSTHEVWRDVDCALFATKKILKLAHEEKRPIHILHVTTAEEMALLGQHRAFATCEVLANHLTLHSPECYEKLGGMAVLNPPLRGKAHQDALWQGLRDGRVDVLSSDHAPHALEEKEREWSACSSGLTGIQTLLPIMLDHVNAGRLTLERLVDLMAAGPARVYGMPTKGRLAVGYDADFTIVDMKKEAKISKEKLVSPCGWSPFDGKSIRGWPVMTIVNGQIVMREHEITASKAVGKLPLFFS
ncbi:dihydroorotase [Acetobacteraceae bacterium]|nr:dihydroorotase [Acetobacteraceae bacterium]